MQYKVYDYEAWGNEVDGYSVNSKTPTSCIVELPESYTRRDVVKALIDGGYFRETAMQSVGGIEIMDNGDGVIYLDYKQCPHCELVRVQ